MRFLWTNLNEQDRAAFRTNIAFLDGRLAERATVDWALRLKTSDTVKRLALLELVNKPAGQRIGEPWRTAWRLIEESWNSPLLNEDDLAGPYHVQSRLRAEDRSGSLVLAIVELVAPRLKVEPFSSLHLQYRKPPKQPKKIVDLFSVRLGSRGIVDPGVLKIGDLTDPSFLLSLASALDSVVSNGLDIARRIGWDGERRLWQLGQLHRVYYVPRSERVDGEHEPDEYHHGIAPSVKLLHAVVSRLVDIDFSLAIKFIHRWKATDSPVHLRLWAALSRDSRVTSADEVGTSLLSLDDRRFWYLHDYPEIAELRAKRFIELDSHQQVVLTARIRKRPPRKQWPKDADADRVENARTYWAVRELRRIEIAGATLPQSAKSWLDGKIKEFPELVQMDRADAGYMSSPKARFVPPNPDNRYDSLVGEPRLNALETALSSKRGGSEDDPASRAADWIRHPGNAAQLIADLESVPDGGGAFARVWEQFGWTHSPTAGNAESSTQRDLSEETIRVVRLLAKLSEATIRQAIDGISHWFSTWEKQVVNLPKWLSVWLKLWPIAVDITNAKHSVEEGSIEDDIDLSTVVRTSDDREPMDLDTLNTPAGKLVGTFLAACPNLQENPRPFDVDGPPRAMRDVIIASTGRAGLIARHRMIEWLPYFLRADSDWTQKYLITPLLTNNLQAIALWRAIARRTRFSDVLEIIGNPMAERAVDLRLGRETRRSLVFSLVIECLHAFRERRDPVVQYTRIQQMIRSLDDEVRAYAAEAIERFVRDVSSPNEDVPEAPRPEDLFRSAAAPFLQQVWPQERSLATPGVSKALADLPAAAQNAFAEAVNAIEPFLVPFECWSMIEYGLYGEKDGRSVLSNVDNREKATAFLHLLDLTIGTSEGSVIPHDLSDALDQIRRVAPTLEENKVFQRLAAAARRG